MIKHLSQNNKVLGEVFLPEARMGIHIRINYNQKI